MSIRISVAICALLLGLPCAPALADDAALRTALEAARRDFEARGPASLDRLDLDAVQTVCNRWANNPPSKLQSLLQAEQLAAVKYPEGGDYLGDWKKGEALAQSGRGLTWSDGAKVAAGGNCYNCHELASTELAYGTLGPSLARYGERRGRSPDLLRYTWAKIYNAKASSLCSNMPRFGHSGALGEAQIRDIMAYLFDPQSPVNR
ncbi:MAG: sulfur oxidation c-type cytochrome SoxX [Rhodocyclaceae bacterium]|nr:sulfur oxidation c-type cytochrome SoxX [Rhodocyclaceae bacterium]